MPALSFAVAALAANESANATWAPVHYPANSRFSNLSLVINSTVSPGIFNSSITPASVYGEYNYCNMPHVRKQEYKVAPSNYTLKYVEIIHRHHVRTPYTSNTFFKEDISWDCSNALPVHYGASKNSSELRWSAFTDAANPMIAAYGPGFEGSNCQFPQLTIQGLADSHQHGADLAAVYRDKLNFLPKSPSNTSVSMRVTNNVITSQVLGALATGLFPECSKDGFTAVIQSSQWDSLEPTYSCPAADALRSGGEGSNPLWTEHLLAAQSLYANLSAVSGVTTNMTADKGGWYTSFDHYFDNLSSKQCHGKRLPCSTNSTSVCVTQAEANEVYRLGQLEYNYRWRGSENATRLSILKYAAFTRELQSHLKSVISGNSSMKYRHNVAHDGSMAPLLGLLQVDEMIWPGMGAEIAFELYKASKAWFLRVLWGGQPLKTSTPLGTLDMVPIDTFMAYLEQQLPSELRAACSA